MLVLLAEGLTVTAVAQRVGTTRRFVYQWAQRFVQHGIAGLADKPGRGRRPGLTTPAKDKQASRRQQGTDPQQAVR
jgi:transposase